jgi:hypothetical protein
VSASEWVPAGIAAAAGLGAAGLSYRQAARAMRAQVRMDRAKVDAAAYERAKEMYEAGIRQLQDQVARTNQELQVERTARHEAEEREAKLRVRVAALEEIVSQMPGSGEVT